MLTLPEFQKLPKEAQFHYIWGKCRYLATRKEAALIVNLYHSGNFFIEMEYYGHNGRIRMVRPFYSSERLSDYVSQIDVLFLLPKRAIRTSTYRHKLSVLAKLPYWVWGSLLMKFLAFLAMIRFWLKFVFS